jgi:transcriptional regulator with XRE-family HTH domain
VNRLKNPKKEIIAGIVRERKTQGITQDELARRLGTQQSNISRFESRQYNPSVDFLDRVARSLGKELHIELSIFDALIIGELSAAVRDFIYSDSWRYTVYFALVNTLFYIAGFSVTQRAAMNSDTGVGTGVAVGIGAAGSYVLLGTVYPLVNNVIASFEINKIGSQEFLAQAVESNREGMINAVEALSSSSGLEFLVTGYEKLMMYVILLAASTILYLAISHRSNFSYMFLVFGMMFLIFIPPALFSSGLISSPIVLELLMTVGAAGFVSVAIWHVSKYGENPLKF